MASMDGAAGFERLVNGAAQTVANIKREDVSTPVAFSIPKKIDFNQWNTEWNPVSSSPGEPFPMLRFPLVLPPG